MNKPTEHSERTCNYFACHAGGNGCPYVANPNHKPSDKPTKREELTDKEYIAELEKIIIFLCDVYAQGQDSLVCQTDSSGQVDENWMNIMMSFPTIQGTINRIYVKKIGDLRTPLGNREAVKLGFKELYERLAVRRKAGLHE